MERYYSTDQSPERAVGPTEGEEEEEEVVVVTVPYIIVY
jgi:hypothetical protein